MAKTIPYTTPPTSEWVELLVAEDKAESIPTNAIVSAPDANGRVRVRFPADYLQSDGVTFDRDFILKAYAWPESRRATLPESGVVP